MCYIFYTFEFLFLSINGYKARKKHLSTYFGTNPAYITLALDIFFIDIFVFHFVSPVFGERRAQFEFWGFILLVVFVEGGL